MHEGLRALEAHLEPFGLNHLGVVTRARYDEAAPPPFRADVIHAPARAVIVVGSGGRAHWDAFLRHLARDPVAHLARTSHPLDDFMRATLPPLPGCRVVFPSHWSFDFMKLAELAGMGTPSRVGTLVSARFGPWFGLRAAIFTPDELPGSPMAPSLCDGCAAPCIAACPVGAAGVGFDWRACVDERLRPGSGCSARCHARLACVVAPDEAYDELELAYHYDRAEGRRRLCAHFGVADEVGPG